MAEIIVALDLPTAADAFRLLDRLPDARWVKVGSILFTREGAPLVRALRERHLEVFLDLKWHDIPNTVAGAVESARSLGVAMATVHTLGGRTMLEAAARAANGALGLVGVTVLTSHTAADYAHTLGRPSVALDAEAERLATEAIGAGLRGVVCSPHEVARLRARLGDAWIVVPGIRRPSDATGDQARIASPAQAVQDGASHLVIGRPILQAADPATAYREIAQEAACAVR